MTRTSREVIQVFLVFCLCIAWLFAWCYSVTGQLWQHTSNSHLMNSGAAVFHRSFGKVSRDTKTKKQVFRRFCQDWWGGRGWLWGGAKMTSWQPDRTDADFFRTSRRPSKSATCEKGPWSRLQSTSAYTVDAECPLDSFRGSSVKIGTIQRRLAWPLRKDDAHKSIRK